MIVKALCNIGTDLLDTPLLEGEQREVSGEAAARCVAANAAVVVELPPPLKLKAVPPPLAVQAGPTPREMVKPPKAKSKTEL